MTAKTWVITLAPGQDVAAASREMKKAGFDVSAAMHDIGIVTGAGSDDVANLVRALPGIADMTQDDTIDIGPPGSPDTW